MYYGLDLAQKRKGFPAGFERISVSGKKPEYPCASLFVVSFSYEGQTRTRRGGPPMK